MYHIRTILVHVFTVHCSCAGGDHGRAGESVLASARALAPGVRRVCDQVFRARARPLPQGSRAYISHNIFYMAYIYYIYEVS